MKPIADVPPEPQPPEPPEPSPMLTRVLIAAGVLLVLIFVYLWWKGWL